ncbi:MAG TPA: DUF2312 domain-containing protein [Acidocella sp.]|nr:DUF2312 domain-containing protein [Acidocella sp.]
MAKKPTTQAYTPPPPNERLRSLVQRIERLNEEVASLKADIEDIYTEAKSAGFDVKIVRQMVRERAMSEAELEESIALAEIYRAALGMLSGTPLGDYARKRFDDTIQKAEPKPSSDDTKQQGAEKPGTANSRAAAEPPKPPPEPEITEADISAAKIAGGDAQKAGISIVKNPHSFGDPRRAAWDEGFCSSAGHDGMEVPDAWRRKPKSTGADGKSP